MRNAVVLLACVLSACVAQRPEDVAAYVTSPGPWALTELNGAAYPGISYIMLEGDGGITGQGPCNQFGGRQTAVYPWFAVESLVTTKMACPDLAAESAFLSALQSVTLAEASGPVLILKDTTGTKMVFRLNRSGSLFSLEP